MNSNTAAFEAAATSTATDGPRTTMQPVPAPTKKLPAISADIVEGSLILTFATGQCLSANPANLSESIRGEAILHGLKQKLVDAAAITRDTSTGRSATAQDKYEAVLEVFTRITSENGTWNKVRGEGGGVSGLGLLVRALMQMSGKSREVIEAQLEPKTKEQKAALRDNPKVAAIMAELRAAGSKIDSDELLDGLLN